MASKKNVLLMALLMIVFNTVSFAQTSTDWGWDWKDSSKVSTRHIPQYNEFLNNQYPYPAQPRDQWELGIGLSVPVLSAALDNGIGIGGTITLRKSLNNTFSVRPYISYYSNSGSGTGYANTSNVLGATEPYGYKLSSFHFGADVLTSLNTASYYRGNPTVNVYLITGLEAYTANVQQSTNNGPYTTFSNPSTNGFLNHVGVNLGTGIAFKITDKVNLALEAKATFTNNSWLDAYSSPWSTANDAFFVGTAKLNFNLGDNTKRVQPLWWINPNNFVYSELNSPKHMKMPKVVLPDADGDGVTDQFDLEPNTPPGAPVDSHGRALDTDGDGVPDYRDKEPLTPRNCFPVNNDGVGTCPEPPCCKELRDAIANIRPVAPTCNLSDLPSIHFKSGIKLSKDAEKLLAAAASKIKENPACKVKLIGHPTASKAAQQLSYERVSAIKKYFVEKQGISESRIIFNYDGGAGDASTIDLQGTTEDGPNTVSPPHPNLRTKQ